MILHEREETRRGGAISNFKRMCIFLRYVSDPGFQMGIGAEYGVERSTVSKICWSVCEQIAAIAPEYVKFPRTEEEFRHAQNEWRQHMRFPRAIGAVDCSHVSVSKPNRHGDEYINRKGFSSLNVQFTVDVRCRITSVDCRWPGSVHDARIWRNSEIAQRMQGSNSILLGDSAYPLTPFLQTPIRNPLTRAEIAFNRVHASERVVVERTIGLLKRRFPMLGSRIRVPLQRVPTYVVACVVLHNISILLNDHLDEDEGEEEQIADDEEEEMRAEREGQALRREGDRLRGDIANYLLRTE